VPSRFAWGSMEVTSTATRTATSLGPPLKPRRRHGLSTPAPGNPPEPLQIRAIPADNRAAAMDEVLGRGLSPVSMEDSLRACAAKSSTSQRRAKGARLLVRSSADNVPE